MELNVRRIDELMTERNINQTTLADSIGVTRQYLSQALKDGKSSFQAAANMAAVLDVRVIDIATIGQKGVKLDPAALNAAMFERKLTYKALAKLAGVAPQTISKAATGDAVTDRIANKVAWALGVDLNTLKQKGG